MDGALKAKRRKSEMKIQVWTRSVPADYPYEQLIAEAGLVDSKGIVKNGTPLGTGVGVFDAKKNAGLIAFNASKRKDGEYIVYYWREA